MRMIASSAIVMGAMMIILRMVVMAMMIIVHRVLDMFDCAQRGSRRKSGRQAPAVETGEQCGEYAYKEGIAAPKAQSGIGRFDNRVL